MPTTGSPGLNSAPHHRRSKLPLTLIRHGGGLIGFGVLFGFLIPLVPYARLGLTAHIQFCVQGGMVLATGLVLQSDPLGSSSNGDIPKQSVRLAERLSWWQKQVIYLGCTGIWVTLLAEAANAWWGTRWVLPIAHQAAGLTGSDLAPRWKEIVMVATHWPFTPPLALVWPIILSKLW
ncbi:hypothetical protein ACHAQJ_008493 [Trichoderma viride]